MNPIVDYFQGRLRRRIFLWLATSIFVSGLITGLVFHIAHKADSSSFEARRGGRIGRFLANRFSARWDDGQARDALARDLARELDLGVTLLGPTRANLGHYGPPCDYPALEAPVARSGETVGYFQLCIEHGPGGGVARLALPLCFSLVLLWFAAGAMARRISRPVEVVAQIAESVGSGSLDVRAALPREGHGEVRLLAQAIETMASRIEKQLSDQRALLAAVSHEIRTPLARVRIVVELLRGRYGEDPYLDDLDREMTEMDALVGDLLASSRLDFATLAKATLDASALAREALRLAELPASLLHADGKEPPLRGDPTLLTRAIVNLLMNGKNHAGGPTALRIGVRGDSLFFEVDDEGEGFEPEELRTAFEPFKTRAKKGSRRDVSSVGLGLSLVQRIAEAHGGTAYARNREPRGATVGFSLRVQGANDSKGQGATG